MRIIADYLYARGQAFSVAFIPLYVNPALGIENDLLKDQNLYNAHFLFTMDYLYARGGQFGAHGLSHQDRDTVSADGYEFGPNTPFSLEEIRQRMLRAREIIETLGFPVEFFEFPHYACTENQLKIAGELYDLIYHYKPGQSKTQIYVESVGGKSVTYLPTPLDHLRSVYDKADLLKRIEFLPENQVMSLFFHPALEYHYISYSIENGKRLYFYDEAGALPQILQKITARGYRFSKLPQ
jgi:hypothetical protein